MAKAAPRACMDTAATILIQKIKENPKCFSTKPCLLFVGPISSGKSSVVNTFLSAGTDDIVQKAESGIDTKSLTTKFTRYDGVGDLKNAYRMCDTTGILDDITRGIRAQDIVEVIRGHVAQATRYLPPTTISKPSRLNPLMSLNPLILETFYPPSFQTDKDISEDDPKYVKVPTDQDKSHCLVIVLDSTNVTELPKTYREKVKDAIRAARAEEIPTAIVLTKIDKVCVHVMKDKSKVFTCKHTKDTVARTSELFGLLESKVFPVINYSSQVSKDEASPIDTIALLALQKLLKLSYDYLEGNELS